MTSGPVVVAVLEGEGAIARWRELMGPTDSTKAPKGTIRGDFGTDVERNASHGSDAPETARVEIAYFFNATRDPGAGRGAALSAASGLRVGHQEQQAQVGDGEPEAVALQRADGARHGRSLRPPFRSTRALADLERLSAPLEARARASRGRRARPSREVGALVVARLLLGLEAELLVEGRRRASGRAPASPRAPRAARSPRSPRRARARSAAPRRAPPRGSRGRCARPRRRR